MDRPPEAASRESADAVRLIGALIAVAGAACASIGSPPGGPERTTPPALLRVTPDSGALNVRARNVVFEFDVVVSDRGGGPGGLESMFLISPTDGSPRVSWKRDRIEVRPRGNFRANTAYSVTLLPGISDLRGNVLHDGKTVVFSTGPTIPPFAILGRVFDWMGDRAAPNAFVQVIRQPDSLEYVGTADSTGQFAIGPLQEGTYMVRALIDNNRNRAADPTESWDSVTVAVRGTSPFLELLAAPRDTIAPRLLTVTVSDTLTLAASFDRPLDPDLPLTPASFRVVGADSARLSIARVLTRAQADAEVAARDSAARRDTTARRDSTARLDSARARRDSIQARGAGTQGRVAQLRPSKPSPARDVVIRLDSLTPMRPGASYRVSAVNARGLLGHTGTTARVIIFAIPARRDTTARAPAPAAPVRRPPPQPPAPR